MNFKDLWLYTLNYDSFYKDLNDLKKLNLYVRLNSYHLLFEKLLLFFFKKLHHFLGTPQYVFLYKKKLLKQKQNI